MNVKILISRALPILCFFLGIIAICATLQTLRRLRSYFLETKLPQKSIHYKLTFMRIFKSITPIIGCILYTNKQFDLPVGGHFYLLVWNTSLQWTSYMYFYPDEFNILVVLLIALSCTIVSVLTNLIFLLTFVADFNTPLNPKPKLIQFESFMVISVLLFALSILLSQFYTGNIEAFYAFLLGVGVDLLLRAALSFFLLLFKAFPDYRMKYHTFAEERTAKALKEQSIMDINAMKSSPRLEREPCEQKESFIDNESEEEVILDYDMFCSTPKAQFYIKHSSPSPQKYLKSCENNLEEDNYNAEEGNKYSVEEGNKYSVEEGNKYSVEEGNKYSVEEGNKYSVEEETTGCIPEYTLFEKTTRLRGPKIKDKEVRAKELRHYQLKELNRREFYHKGNQPNTDTNFAIKTKGGTLTIELSEKSESLNNEPAEIVLFMPSKNGNARKFALDNSEDCPSEANTDSLTLKKSAIIENKGTKYSDNNTTKLISDTGAVKLNETQKGFLKFLGNKKNEDLGSNKRGEDPNFSSISQQKLSLDNRTNANFRNKELDKNRNKELDKNTNKEFDKNTNKEFDKNTNKEFDKNRFNEHRSLSKNTKYIEQSISKTHSEKKINYNSYQEDISAHSNYLKKFNLNSKIREALKNENRHLEDTTDLERTQKYNR